MKRANVIFLFFVIFFTTACSQVGSAISSTGNYVSKAGNFIGGEKEKPKVLESNNANINNRVKSNIPQVSTALVKINTTDKANLRANGKPSRIKITVLQLKSVGKFGSSRISSLKKDLETTLGSDLISQESLSLLPNSEKKLQFELDSSTRALGVFGSFNQLNNTIWRTILNIPKKKAKVYAIHVLVDSKSISVKKN